jgi:hypothetical protein
MPVLKRSPKVVSKEKIASLVEPPDRRYEGMAQVRLGTMAPEENFWFPDGYQFLSGVVLYQSIGSTYCRVRAVKPFAACEVIEDTYLSSGSIVIAKEKRHDARRPAVRSAELHQKSGMEGFPKS